MTYVLVIPEYSTLKNVFKHILLQRHTKTYGVITIINYHNFVFVWYVAIECHYTLHIA